MARLKSKSPVSRQAERERAQAAAMNDVKIGADRRREQSEKLRKLRMESENEPAKLFLMWRERKLKKRA